MRIQRLLGLTLCAVVSSWLLGVGLLLAAAHAGCVGPSLAVGATVDPGQPSSPPANLIRGHSITIAGVFFHAGCEDTLSSSGPGCRAAQPADPQTPLHDVHLILTQGDHRWELGTADAADRDRQYVITWTVLVPADATPGAATLTAESAALPVQIS